MPNGDDITVRQMLELVVQKFEQQEKTLGKVESRLDKVEEIVLGLRTGDLQQIKLDLNDLKHQAASNNHREDIERVAKRVVAFDNRLVAVESTVAETAKVSGIDERLREMEKLKPEVKRVTTLDTRVRAIEDKHIELAGATKALSPLGKVIIGVLSAILLASILAYLGLGS